MVNLMKVKRTSIAVVVALIILFCVRRNIQVSRAKYVRTHTERHYPNSLSHYQDVSGRPSNHGEDITFQRLK